jgi:pimeloyl-ACP methyl ester carboxylesterase
MQKPVLLVVVAVALIAGLAMAGAVRTPSASGAAASAAPGAAGPDECVGPLRTPPAAAPAGFTHRHAVVDGVQLHYVVGGRGEQVVVLLHGWPENWYAWAELMPALARDYTVVAVDLPGLGDSRGSPPSYDKKTLAWYVHRLVADILGYRRAHLVGHDFGAAVAFAYAAFHRESAASLTIMDFPLSGPATDQQQLRALLWWFGFHDVAQLPEQLVDGRQRTYLGWFYANFVAAPNRIEPVAVTEYVRTYCKPSVLHGGFELYRTSAIDTSDNSSLTTNRLTLPILVMSPPRSNDPNAEKAQLRSVIQPMAAGPISVELVPQSGHFVPEENPEFVATQLRAFINSSP